MNIAVYGGSFDPPHAGHTALADSIRKQLNPDKLIIVPANIPPHKTLSSDSPSAQERLELCRIAFNGIAEVSDIELKRGGLSYTWQTVEELKKLYPDSTITLVIGTDMFLCFEAWRNSGYLAENCRAAVACRESGSMEKILAHANLLKNTLGLSSVVLNIDPIECSSSEIRSALVNGERSEYLSDEVYSEIIKNNYYHAGVNLEWLREKSYACLKPSRIPHVAGCEQTAVRLAERWGADVKDAAVAGILHDITKKCSFEEQLQLCSDYGIIIGDEEKKCPQILHAVTGAEYSRRRFGISQEIYGAVRWHTTGRPCMSRLEKIIFLADLIEPTRSFDGVEALRKLAFEDLDETMSEALKQTIHFITASGKDLYKDTLEAYNYYKTRRNAEC